MTRIEQAIRWFRNNNDGEAVPVRHYDVLKRAGMIEIVEDEDEGWFECNLIESVVAAYTRNQKGEK